MDQNPSRNANMSGRLKNSTAHNPNVCPQVRGRPRNRQFRLTSTSANEEELAPNSPPTILNIVVPSQIGSETSVVSSRLNTTSLNVVTKSSAPFTSMLESHESNEDTQKPEFDSWNDQSHATIKSSTKKCQSKSSKAERGFSKEESFESHLSVTACQPCKPAQHDVSYLKQRLVKYRAETESCGDAARLNGQLNEIFVRRLVDIENVATGDTDIKLVTYQEWVDMLMQINEVIIGNMADLESEVAERLECMKRRIQSTCSQTSSNEHKYRQDICALMKLIKNAYHHDNWDIQGLEFQTVNPTEILGMRDNTCSDMEQSNTMRLEYGEDDRDSPNRCCLNEPECILESVIFHPPDVRCGENNRPVNTSSCAGSCANTCSQNENMLVKPMCPGSDIITDNSVDSCKTSSLANPHNSNSNLRALAVEVAAKHDEICDLRRQVSCLEDEIQKAQQKLQLKDNVIKELRNDLRCVNTKLIDNGSGVCGACREESANYNMPPINLEQHSSRSASTQVSAGMELCNQVSFIAENLSYDSLSNAGQVEQQKLKALEFELNELFQVTREFKIQNLEYHRKRLSDILNKSETEKAEAYRKLDHIRKQLINLEASSAISSKSCCNDSDSGFSSKCDNDQDAKILDALRNRLQRLNEMNMVLNHRVQTLTIENNELSTCLKTEQTFAKRNSDTLKNLADMICGMSDQEFVYDDIYNRNSESNPFCQAIIKMKCDFEEKERKLMNSLSMKQEQLAKLQKSQICKQHDLEQLDSSTTLSGDCSHGDQFQQPFKLWDKTHMLSTYDSYLNIVNELKNELSFLSRQVAMVQKEFHDSSEHDEERCTKLESSLKILESQNDLLQHALEQVSQDNHKHCYELSQSNENLRCQVQHLQCTILEKEQCIGKLNNMLDQLRCEQQQQYQQRTSDCCLKAKDKEIRELCQKLEQANKKIESLVCELEQSQKQERFLLCETRKLNEELNESKRKHGDVSTQMHRLNTLLKSQNDCRADICKKYEELERNYEDQAKQLRAACAQMNCLQERLALMDKRQEEHNMERNLLRDEVLALKEKEATLLNKQRCLADKLLKTEKELYTAHDVMKEQQHIMQRSESTQKDCTKRLQEANNELKRQFNVLCDDYKQLENEYRKQCDLRKQNEKVIDSFRKWKEAQLKADDATRASFKQYEGHIKLLLEEKQQFTEQYRCLHGDYMALQNELERIKLCTYRFNTSGNSSNISEKSLPQRIELIRSTSLRVSQKSSSLKCDDTSQDASLSTNPL
ncbi:early endosome antigen 1 isoform X3 [Zeugodacus cucurbitae]|uniref:early endosome antigen 1 isoform X3 n=1 Tax=Zeugodacus cucurbitae TaxID=28588 RepID=UPI0023D8E82F|nr:early endosome antigen 1 isoform X3 [Zeugodacus cucurbitae]